MAIEVNHVLDALAFAQKLRRSFPLDQTFYTDDFLTMT
jgi:hypothetical protein